MTDYEKFKWNLDQSLWWQSPAAARLRLEGLYLIRLPAEECAGNFFGLPKAIACYRKPSLPIAKLLP